VSVEMDDRIVALLRPLLDDVEKKLDAEGIELNDAAPWFLGVAEGMAFPVKKKRSLAAFIAWTIKCRGTEDGV
jgi:hypothetical protein